MSYIKRETVSLSLPCSLMSSQGSLLVSSHASITTPPPLCRRRIIWLFLPYRVISWCELNCISFMKTFWWYRVNIPGGMCFLEGHPRMCLWVGALAERSRLIDCHWEIQQSSRPREQTAPYLLDRLDAAVIGPTLRLKKKNTDLA